MTVVRVYVAPVMFAVFVLLAPLAITAQSADAGLQTAIRQALLTDPRTAALSAAQIDAMVLILAGEAQKRGLSARDIEWHPQTYGASAEGDASAQSCGSIPGFLCALNTAFGFEGSDPTIAMGLGITSALLILIIGLMLEMKRRAAASLARAAAPPPHLQ